MPLVQAVLKNKNPGNSVYTLYSGGSYKSPTMTDNTPVKKSHNSQSIQLVLANSLHAIQTQRKEKDQRGKKALPFPVARRSIPRWSSSCCLPSQIFLRLLTVLTVLQSCCGTAVEKKKGREEKGRCLNYIESPPKPDYRAFWGSLKITLRLYKS